MGSIIQATTISGTIVEKARWQVPNLSNVAINHSIQWSFPVSDPNLISNIRKQSKPHCVVDKNEAGHYAVLTFIVKQMRHMIDVTKDGSSGFETMCIIVPIDRYVEAVMLYLFAPNQCDKRFMESVRGVAYSAPTQNQNQP